MRSALDVGTCRITARGIERRRENRVRIGGGKKPRVLCHDEGFGRISRNAYPVESPCPLQRNRECGRFAPDLAIERGDADRAVGADQFVKLIAAARTQTLRMTADFGRDAINRLCRDHRGKIFVAENILGHRAVHRDRAAATVGTLAIVEKRIIPRQ